MAEPAELLAPVRDFLAAPRCAVLSTLTAAGAPHQAVLHYLLNSDGLLVNGRPDRLWTKHLRRDPRVSVVVHDADRPLHWVGIKGRAQLLREDQGAVDDAMTLARRYGEDPEAFRHLQRVSFRIVPERVYEYA